MRSRRCARSMNTIKAITTTAITITSRIRPVESAPWRPSSSMLASARWQFGDDASQNDQRNAVADAASGDLLTEPHQEHGAAGQRDRGGNQEEHPGLADHVAGALEADDDAVGLEHSEYRRGSRYTRQRLTTASPSFFSASSFGDTVVSSSMMINADARRDVQREDRHAIDAAAGEHVERAECHRPATGTPACQAADRCRAARYQVPNQ